MSEEYDEHLASLHKAWATPPAVVAGLVADVADTAVVNIRRVVQGEQNEVYDVTLEGTPSLIVRISHGGAEAFEREAWVLGECAARGIRAPRVHGLRRVEVEGKPLAAIVLDKVQGDRLCDVDLADAEVRRVLGEVGGWLRELHAIPVRGFGYLDGRGVGKLATLDDWLIDLTTSPTFEEAGRSVGLPATTIRGWLREIVDSLRAAPPRAALIHNDLLAGHVMVHDGSLSAIIDFGEVAAEPIANDFAKWDFVEGERFPIEWIQDGYRDASLFQPPNDRTYRALWLASSRLSTRDPWETWRLSPRRSASTSAQASASLRSCAYRAVSRSKKTRRSSASAASSSNSVIGARSPSPAQRNVGIRRVSTDPLTAQLSDAAPILSAAFRAPGSAPGG